MDVMSSGRTISYSAPKRAGANSEQLRNQNTILFINIVTRQLAWHRLNQYLRRYMN